MQRRQKKRLWWVTIKWNEPLPFVGNFIIILSPKMCLDKKEQELNKVSKLITKPERQRQSEWEGERERVVKSGTKRKKSKRKLFEADSGWNSCWASHHCLGFFFVCALHSFTHPFVRWQRRWEFQVADRPTPQKQNWIWILNFSSASLHLVPCGRHRVPSWRMHS